MSDLRPGFRVAAVVTGVVVAWMAIGIAFWPRIDSVPSPPPTIVVALSSGARSDTTLDPIGALRLALAIDRAQRWGARIVTTRAVNWPKRLTTDGGERRMIDRSGLQSAWSTAPGIATSTRDEAIRVGRIVSRRSRIAVVTSRMHTRRACATFEHYGFLVTCVASTEPWWFAPYDFVYEQLAMIKYGVKGWM